MTWRMRPNPDEPSGDGLAEIELRRRLIAEQKRAKVPTTYDERKPRTPPLRHRVHLRKADQ